MPPHSTTNASVAPHMAFGSFEPSFLQQHQVHSPPYLNNNSNPPPTNDYLSHHRPKVAMLFNALLFSMRQVTDWTHAFHYPRYLNSPPSMNLNPSNWPLPNGLPPNLPRPRSRLTGIHRHTNLKFHLFSLTFDYNCTVILTYPPLPS